MLWLGVTTAWDTVFKGHSSRKVKSRCPRGTQIKCLSHFTASQAHLKSKHRCLSGSHWVFPCTSNTILSYKCQYCHIQKVAAYFPLVPERNRRGNRQKEDFLQGSFSISMSELGFLVLSEMYNGTECGLLETAAPVTGNLSSAQRADTNLIMSNGGFKQPATRTLENLRQVLSHSDHCNPPLIQIKCSFSMMEADRNLSRGCGLSH